MSKQSEAREILGHYARKSQASSKAYLLGYNLGHKAGYDRALGDVLKGVDARRGWDRDDGFIYFSNLNEVIEKLRAENGAGEK